MSVSKLGSIIAAGILMMSLNNSAFASDERDDSWWHGWGMGRMMNGWGMGHMMGGWCRQDSAKECSVDTKIDGRLAFLKAELKITETQTPTWDELAKVIRTTGEAHNDMRRGMMDQMRDGTFFKMPLPDRLVFQQTHLEARLDQVKSVKEAVGKLYAVLDGDQKKVADEIVLPMMGMGMGIGMGMRRGMGPHMMYGQ